MSARGRLLRALVVGLLAAALTVAVSAAGALDRVEDALVDARFDVRGSQGPPEDVVVVGIDERTFERLNRRWPFRRAIHAEAIAALRAAGARTIVYDVQFSEGSPRPRDDRALIDAAASDDVLLGTSEVSAAGEPVVLGGRRVRAGHALFPADDDGVLRRLRGRIAGVPHLAALAAEADPDRPETWIDFAGPPGTVDEIPFWQVVEGAPLGVRDKVVVVGATAPSLQDVHRTAAGGGLMAGAEVHANAIQTLLDGSPLRDAPAAVGVLLVLAAALLAPLATLPGPPARAVLRALAASALGIAALLCGGQLAFLGGIVVPMAAPLLALVLSTAGAVALTYGVEVRSRRHVRATFERFVPPAVVDEILRRGGALESRRLVATVLFCDLRGFTSLAERLEAEQVIAALNRYLELVSGAVFDHGGTVVSYQGDGVLAVFGAPLEQPDHAARALAAARAILDEALPGFDAWLRAQGLAGPERLEVGIGLNTGPVMSGSVGSRRRIEYAAVGDATNVAARLQALGRDAPERLFVSSATYDALGDAAAGLGLHGPVRLRGRREPVTVYAAR